MVYLGLRGKNLLAGITISSGLGFILFGTRLYVFTPTTREDHTTTRSYGEADTLCLSRL
jgi:hypothetical protein